MITATTDSRDVTLFVELIAVDGVTSYLPHGTLRVAIHLHRRLQEQVANVLLAKRGSHTTHGIQVNDNGTFVVGYPQATMVVFCKAQTRATVSLMRCLEGISVITHSATSIA